MWPTASCGCMKHPLLCVEYSFEIASAALEVSIYRTHTISLHFQSKQNSPNFQAFKAHKTTLALLTLPIILDTHKCCVLVLIDASSPMPFILHMLKAFAISLIRVHQNIVLIYNVLIYRPAFVVLGKGAHHSSIWPVLSSELSNRINRVGLILVADTCGGRKSHGRLFSQSWGGTLLVFSEPRKSHRSKWFEASLKKFGRHIKV